MNISRTIYSNDNLFLNETKYRTRAGRHPSGQRRSQSLRAGTVCSRLEERVLRRGLELELQRRDVARREVDACAQINQ